jgi:N utilization substance protein B
MANRRRAREVVLQLLYEEDLNPGGRSESATERFIHTRLQRRKVLTKFSLELLRGVLAHRTEVDLVISRLSTNWSISRMAVIDRNILRLGAYEILHGGTPGPVAITEAVQIIKRYGDRNSSAFVNGILDRLLHQTKVPKVPTEKGV